MPAKRTRKDGLPYKADRSQRIALKDAVALTSRYRKAAPASEHGGFFYADGIQDILAQPGCSGIRYYHGLDADGRYRIVLVGVDADGNDITARSRPSPAKPAVTSGKVTRSMKAMSVSGDDAVLLDWHLPCPPFCAGDSPLS